MSKVLIHWLNFPEVVFMDFFRSFFMVQDQLVTDLPNNFKWDPSNPDKFPIDIAGTYNLDNLDRVPAIIYNPSGWMVAGLAIRQERHLDIDTTTRTKTDLIQGTGSFHCLSRERSESLLLASIVLRLLLTGDEELRNAGFNKIERPQITAPILQEGNSLPKKYRTDINLTFSYEMEFYIREVGVTLVGIETDVNIGQPINKYSISQVNIV